MPDQPTSPSPASQGLDYRLHIPLLVHSLGIQTTITLVRVTTSYRVLELDLSAAWLGILSAAFALLPVFLGVFVGRFIDRGHDAHAAWIGNALLLIACAGLALSDASVVSLVVFTAVLGVGHIFLMAAHQMICLRSAGAGSREQAFGNLLVVAAIGHGLGPLIISWLGAGARIPPTAILFNLGLAGIALMMALSFTLRPGQKAGQKPEHSDVLSVNALLRIAGLPTVLVASIVTITAMDLVTIYLPLLGVERGIDADQVGMLLTVRAAASMVGRLFYVTLVQSVGRWPLMWTTMIGAAITIAALALPMPLAGVYVACAAMGFALGIASTLSITGAVDVAPVQARATVMSMRISGNRIGQVALPLIAGAIAAATGSAGVLLMLALALTASGVSVKYIPQNR
jgi:MFS family permease